MDQSKVKNNLTPEQIKILKDKATEPPFTSELLNNEEPGIYKCAACGNVLFTSQTKFESHCGWPSFYDVEREGTVEFVQDNSLGMQRTEVICSNCKGHLGHIFEDGPQDKTGLRYCINGAILNFEKKN